MHVPRRLYTTKERPPWEIVEEGDPRAAFLLCPVNGLYADHEAERLGITAYLAAYDAAHAKPAVAEKAVMQDKTENKAVDPQETENKDGVSSDLPPPDAEGEEDTATRGVIMPPESRRLRSR